MIPCEIQEWGVQNALSTRFRGPVQDLPALFGQAYEKVMAYVTSSGEAHPEMAYAVYYNMDMQDLDVEAGFTVLKPLLGKGDVKGVQLAAGTYAICHYKGPYSEVSPAYEELTRFIAERGYQISGPPSEWYLNGPDVPPEDLKTDIAFPVVRIGSAKNG